MRQSDRDDPTRARLSSPSTRVSPLSSEYEPPFLVLDRGLTVRSSNQSAVEQLGDQAAADGQLDQVPGSGGLVALVLRAFSETANLATPVEIGGRSFRASVSPLSDEATPLMLLRLDDLLNAESLFANDPKPPNLPPVTAQTVEALVGILDDRGRLIAVNRAWRARASAYPELAPDQEINGDYLAFCSALPEECASFGRDAAAGIRAVLAGHRDSFSMPYRCRAEGEPSWFRLSVSGLSQSSARPGGAVVVHHDISEQVKLSEEKARQLAALQTSADAIFIVDAAGRIDWANESFLRAHHISPQLLQLSAIPLERAGGQTLREAIDSCRRTGGVWSGEVTLTPASGGPLCVAQTVSPIPDAAGDIGHFVVVQRDLTFQKSAQNRLNYLAEHDAVTGLLNRRSLAARLGPITCQHLQSGQSLAVFSVSLERFKEASETSGHRVGDLILVEIARRLERFLGGRGLAARIDGREFAVVRADCGSRGDAAALAEILLASLANPIEVEGSPLHLGAHLGISIFPADGAGHDDILGNARLALRRARAEGFRGYCFFDPALEAEMAERASIERALAYSLGNGGLGLAYQPQWNLATGRITGAESLLRWNPGTRGKITTSRVVSIAEESGLILPIGRWVTRHALSQLRDWRSRVTLDLEMAVNLSAVQLNQQDVAELFIQAMAEHRVPPRSVKVELTESALVRSSARVGASLNALHEAGVGLVLDDFGTGYAALTYLQRFPIESVKIDCSFVHGIGRHRQDESIVEGIVLLAHSLGLTVIAEGVERQLQLDFLKSVRCDAAQGFLLSQAVPAAEFESLLASGRCMS